MSLIDTTVVKANKMCGMVRRYFVSIAPDIMSNIFDIYIRPVVENCSPLWNPSLFSQIANGKYMYKMGAHLFK